MTKSTFLTILAVGFTSSIELGVLGEAETGRSITNNKNHLRHPAATESSSTTVRRAEKKELVAAAAAGTASADERTLQQADGGGSCYELATWGDLLDAKCEALGQCIDFVCCDYIEGCQAMAIDDCRHYDGFQIAKSNLTGCTQPWMYGCCDTLF
jgi:hypothetical protein